MDLTHTCKATPKQQVIIDTAFTPLLGNTWPWTCPNTVSDGEVKETCSYRT